MTSKQGRLILYQLVEARRILQEALQGKDIKEAASAYFFHSLVNTEEEVAVFFKTEAGRSLAAQFKLG